MINYNIIIDWHKNKHPLYGQDNFANQDSLFYIKQLYELILKPIEDKFGEIFITYGFTSQPLLRYVLKNSPGDMGPELDQHASMEVNTRGNRICKRDGASCDFYVDGYEEKMDVIARFIAENLPYDRLYFGGKDRPIHISFGPENTKYAVIRYYNKNGKRVNGKSAKGTSVVNLFD